MNIIFKNNKQPLYGRQTGEIKVTPFPPSVIKENLSTYNSAYTNDDLLALYSYTGGVAEYVEMMMDDESEEYTQIASWWGRKGENEIDFEWLSQYKIKENCRSFCIFE